MAVVQYSALVTQLRGKLGGSQFNRGSGYYSLQRKSTPTRRDSHAQMIVRSATARASYLWRAETAQRRAEAGQAGISNPVSDRFGQQKTLTAYLQYLKIMTWRILGSADVAGPIVTTPLNSCAIGVSAITATLLSPAGSSLYGIRFDFTRVSVGTPSGAGSMTRMVFRFCVADANGNLTRRSRFVTSISAFTANNNPGSHTVRFYEGSPIMQAGEWLRLEILTYNLAGGGITGRNDYLVQIV